MNEEDIEIDVKVYINKLEKGSWNKDDVEKRQKWVIEQITDILGIKFN